VNKVAQRATLAQRIIARVASVLSTQLTGVALLTFLPLIFNGIIFRPWSAEVREALALAPPTVYAPEVAVGLVVLTLATLIASRDFRFVMCLFSSVILLAMALQIAAKGDAELVDTTLFKIASLQSIDLGTLFILYTFTGFLTFVVILRKPTMSTWLFRLVVVLLLTDIVLTVSGAGYNFLAPLFFAYFPSQISVLACLTILATLRMIAKFYLENAETRAKIHETDPRYMRAVRWTTLKLWWPMLLIFAVFTLAYQLASDPVVNRPLVKHLDNVGLVEEVQNEPSLDRTVEQAAQDAVDRQSEKLQMEFNRSLAEALRGKERTKANVYNAVEDSVPERFPGTEPRSCGFLDFGCYIENGVKSMINSAYRSSRDGMLDDLERNLGNVTDGADDTAQKINTAMTDANQAFALHTKQGITDVATGLRFAGWVALFYSLMVLTKSYMIVFARVFCARVATALATPDADEPEQGDEAEAAAPIGAMTVRGSQHQLDRADGYDRYYVTFRACGNNVVDRRRVPQPMGLVIKRLLSSNYAMCLVDFTAHDGITACDIIVDPPSEIIQWDLKAGDEVFIDLKNLVGFTDTCRLRRCISLSLGALIFGRLVYHSIEGPGRVFLRTVSAPLAGNDPGTTNIMRASSLVAWRRDTEFNVISSLTVGDTFFSGYSVRKADPRDHVVLYDTSQSRRQGATGGILSMTRAFLLPF